MIILSQLATKIGQEVRLPTMSAVIKAEIAQAYYEVCKLISWLPLRKYIDLDFSTVGTAAGMWLPADLIGIDGVYDASSLTPEQNATTAGPQSAIEFLPRDEASSAEQEDYNFRWYYITNSTPLDDADAGMAATRLSTAVVFTPALGGDRSGEWVAIKAMPGFCKLTSNTVLTKGFPGVTNTSPGYGYQVRPVGQKQIACINTLRGLWQTSVRVYYWAYPEPLLADGVPIVVPERLVELMSFIRIVGTYGRREQTANKYREEFKAELDLQLQLNPKFGRRAYPRDKHRRPLTFAAPLFMSQGRNYSGGR